MSDAYISEPNGVACGAGADYGSDEALADAEPEPTGTAATFAAPPTPDSREGNILMNARPDNAVNGLRRLSVIAVALGALAAGTSEAHAATLVVDRDKAQCPQAPYASIQPAVDAAQSGDTVQVCPDLYPEQITVNKPLTLTGQPDAVKAVDCFDPTASQPGDADPTQHAIVDGNGLPAQELFNLGADDIVLEGFVLQGASSYPRPTDYRLLRRAINTSDQYSGYRIRHNLVRLNTVGVQFGSSGIKESRFDANCIRENVWGLGTDDRDLINARVDSNASFKNEIITFEMIVIDPAFPHRLENVTFAENVSRQDGWAFWLADSKNSRLEENVVIDANRTAIVIQRAHEGLVVAGNRAVGPASLGIFADESSRSHGTRIADNEVVAPVFAGIDLRGVHDRLVVADNRVLGSQLSGGIIPRGTLSASLITRNTSMMNRGTGISVLATGSAGNVVSENVIEGNGASGLFLSATFRGSYVISNDVHRNATNGIAAAAGSIGHRLEHNSMHGNALFDANDANPLSSNVWIDTDCVTDNKGGAICGVD